MFAAYDAINFLAIALRREKTKNATRDDGMAALPASVNESEIQAR